MDLHAKCEEYLLSKYALEDEARSCPDFLDFFASLSDDDDFLALSFDIYIGLDGEHGLSTFELLLDLSNLDIRGIRNLFTELREEDFTDHLSNTEIHRLIGVILWGV